MVTGVALVDDIARHCALPACDATIQNIPGRPERRYCTAAHRGAARQARRAAMRPEQQARLVETLPWLAEPEPARRGGVAPPARAGSHLRPRLRCRGALALLGAVGILASGYSITGSEPAEQAAAPPPAAPGGESADEWAARAEVTLTSVDQQLDVIDRTESAWNSTPTPRPRSTPPAPVAALQGRKALLERRKAALQSQLDSYRALGRTRTDLSLSEHHLDAVEDALTSTSAASAATSPDAAAALAELEQQRDLRLRQRDAKRAELAGLEGNVERATRTPLPDDGEETAAVTASVLEIIHTGGRDHGPPPPKRGPNRPEVVAGAREGAQAQERQSTTTSAPPDPRGPRDESAERRADSERRAARADAAERDRPEDPLEKVDRAVDGMAGSGGSTGGAPDRAPMTAADAGGRTAESGGWTGGAPDRVPVTADAGRRGRPSQTDHAEAERVPGPVGDLRGATGGKPGDQWTGSSRTTDTTVRSGSERAGGSADQARPAPAKTAGRPVRNATPPSDAPGYGPDMVVVVVEETPSTPRYDPGGSPASQPRAATGSGSMRTPTSQTYTAPEASRGTGAAGRPDARTPDAPFAGYPDSGRPAPGAGPSRPDSRASAASGPGGSGSTPRVSDSRSPDSRSPDSRNPGVRNSDSRDRARSASDRRGVPEPTSEGPGSVRKEAGESRSAAADTSRSGRAGPDRHRSGGAGPGAERSGRGSSGGGSGAEKSGRERSAHGRADGGRADGGRADGGRADSRRSRGGAAGAARSGGARSGADGPSPRSTRSGSSSDGAADRSGSGRAVSGRTPSRSVTPGDGSHTERFTRSTGGSTGSSS